MLASERPEAWAVELAALCRSLREGSPGFAAAQTHDSTPAGSSKNCRRKLRAQVAQSFEGSVRRPKLPLLPAHQKALRDMGANAFKHGSGTRHASAVAGTTSLVDLLVGGLKEAAAEVLEATSASASSFSTSSSGRTAHAYECYGQSQTTISAKQTSKPGFQNLLPLIRSSCTRILQPPHSTTQGSLPIITWSAAGV